MKIDTQRLSAHILESLSPDRRGLVAIAGPPGAGKSTLSAALSEQISSLGKRVCTVPMDGFHLDNRLLNDMGLLNRKGAPNTFDSLGFVQTIKRIHSSNEAVIVPVFDRKQDLAIAGAQRVGSNDAVVLVEGNYLLVDEHPWSELYPLFDLRLFINPGLDVVQSRILSRWNEAGLDQQTIQSKAFENDMPNADYVLKHSITDQVIQIDASHDQWVFGKN